MKIKFFCPLWGFEHLKIKLYLDKLINSGYNGIDTWIPQEKADKHILFDCLQKKQLLIITHQHAANGADFKRFKSSFIKELQKCAEPGPVLINSHTGRDYFSIDENIQLIDIASDFSAKTGITICHETHRGRMGYAPQNMQEIFKYRSDFNITADFSHWVCVTESMLEHFKSIMDLTIPKVRHIHARVGFEQGPQVPDPRAPEWNYALQQFLKWWDAIVDANANQSQEILTITTEFGPKPYMMQIPFTTAPVADQFEINLFMKDLLRNRYGDHS